MSILCVAVCSREKQKYALFPSPISISPYQLIYVLRNRVLCNTNARHLCVFPNTWNDSKSSRLMRCGEMFQSKTQRKDQLWTYTIYFLWYKASSFLWLRSTARQSSSTACKCINTCQRKEPPCVPCTTNFWINYFLPSK